MTSVSSGARRSRSLNGADVYVLRDPGDEKSSITVSADGKATIHRIKAEEGELTFTEWNAVKPFAAPSADQIAEIPPACDEPILRAALLSARPYDPLTAPPQLAARAARGPTVGPWCSSVYPCWPGC